MEGLKDRVAVNTGNTETANTETANTRPAPSSTGTSTEGPRTFNRSNDDRPRPTYRRNKNFKKRKKVCRFCDEQTAVDYKNIRSLKYYVTERGKILPSRISGVCAKHQRRLGTAVKRARILALLSFSSIHDMKRS